MRGTRAQAQRVFDTPIESFGAGKRTVYENLEAPAVAASLAPRIQAVMGLSNADEPATAPQSVKQCAQAGGGYACADGCVQNVTKYVPVIAFGLVAWLLNIFTFFLPGLPKGSGTVVGPAALTLAFCAGAYGYAGFQKGLQALSHKRPYAAMDGSGQKIGLLEFDTYRPSDVLDWLNLLGLGASEASRLSKVSVNGGVSSPGAGESEVLLDIDTVLGLAPNVGSYVVYDAPPSTSFVQMFQAMVADGDTVISNSWDQCEDQTPEADAQAIDSVLASAAASGVTVVNGSGDDATNCLDGSAKTVGVPADSPNATAVGGTSPTFGPGLTYGSETWWDDRNADPPSGAGGYGVSRYFSRPSYQNGLTTASMRSVPDMSYDADPVDGLELCQADAGGCPDGFDWGGTSMAAPEVAAQVAELNLALGHDVGNSNTALYPLAGTSAFHTAASMGSDFAHVGLGSPNFSAVYEHLAGASPGAVSASQSAVGVIGQPQADGSQQGLVRVDLEDANGDPVGGKTVTLTPNAGSTAVVTPSSATTDATDGAAVFTITDSTAQTVTFTATDTTDGVTLSSQPTMTFVTPVATGAEISAIPSTVTNDGSSQATISVYLENSLGQPAAGKTVSLSDNGASAVISPASGQAVTGSNGVATFTAADVSEQSVSFTATDVSDGNLPVPGSAVVTFEPGGSSSSCSDTSPTPASGYSVGPWATGLTYNPQALDIDGVDFYACSGIEQPAYDASGNLYVPDAVSGQIYVLGPSGGQAGQADALPDATFSPGQLGGLAFGKDGSLYAGLPITSNSFFDPEVVQLDPTTGAIERVVATSADGLQDCPYAMAVDPLSGDLFTADVCNFGSQGLSRISDPESANPTVTTYTTLPVGGNVSSDGITFAPDGTIYVALPGEDEVVSVTGTNGPATPVVTPVASGLSYEPYGVAVASTDAAGHATALYVTGSSSPTGDMSLVNLTQTLPNSTTIASGSDDLTTDVLGPDGCVYAADLDQILRISAGSACAGASSNTPEVTLTQSSGSASPTTGSSVGFAASLENVSSPSGTPVHFTISGPNFGAKLADASSSGQATASYAGVFQGVDTVTASAVVNGNVITSVPVEVHWMAGQDTTFLDLNASQQGGPLGQAATVTASLWDETQTPVAAIAGQSITLRLGGATCSAQTNSDGVASCQLVPSSVGLLPLSASYAGASQYTASTATNSFDATLGTPVDTALPTISGTPTPGNTLTCSSGTWSNDPTGFGYQWERGGKPIAGATKRTYV
ncbi:MAG: Ig-like domain-containing protein, partial [Solirubrobacteraceae bacterium]